MSLHELREQLRDALAHLYDPVHLQSHSLLDALDVCPLAGETEAQALRRVLRDAVSDLRPPSEVLPTSSEWLPYRVLWSHYVRGLPVNRICGDLGLSRASFFRRQNEALAAAAAILADKAKVASGPAEPLEALDGQALERSMGLAAAMPAEAISLAEMMRGVLRTLTPLAEQRELTIRMHVPDAMPPAYAANPVVRQVLLDVLSRAIGLLQSDTLQVALTHRGREAVWRLCAVRKPDALSPLCGAMCTTDVSRRLLDLCKGRIQCVRDPASVAVMLSMAIVRSEAVVLVIDDDPRTIALYRGYVESERCTVVGARNSSEAAEALAEIVPDLILLDVILPDEDGWAILASLRERPATADIPVIVCSVVEKPELALALGAAQVLTKPIERHALLQAVERYLAPADSSA
jgi:CheY-like chemotaxis protein